MWNDISRATFMSCLAFVLAIGPRSPLAAQNCPSELVLETPAVIAQAEAVGLDLSVTIAWADLPDLPASATLELHDRLDAVVASKLVTPAAGTMKTVLLSAALAAIDVHGLAYTIELSDGLMEPFPIQVDLVSSAAGCDLRVSPIEATPVPLDQELGEILTTLANNGSQDLLADALDSFPNLECKIATLAVALDKLDDRAGIPAGSCSCPWTGWTSRDPQEWEGSWSQGPPRELLRFNGPGGIHYLGAQTIEGKVGATVSGGTRFGLELRCWKFSAWTTDTIAVSVSGEPKTPIRSPVLGPCTKLCEGEVLHEIAYEGELDALATSQSAGGALAAASERVSHTIDGQEVFASQADVRAEALPEAGQTDETCVSKTNVWLRGEPTTAQFHASGEVSVDAGAKHAGSHAFAELVNALRLRATGYAGCAVEPEASVHSLWFADLAGAGGINLEPW